MNNLSGRVIQIAGSCSSNADPQQIDYSHNLVRHLTYELLNNGATITTIVGKDPTFSIGEILKSHVYYWDIIEVALHLFESHEDLINPQLIVITSEKSEMQIPAHRKELWGSLLEKRIAKIIRINPGWNAGAYRRTIQENSSDALICIGGGEGVEHLASLYSSHRKTVIPLDLNIESTYGDGLGGSFLLSRLFPTRINTFIPLSNHRTLSDYIRLKWENWVDYPDRLAHEIVKFLKRYLKLQVFYIRLLNKNCKEYNDVETFFRNVIDKSISQMNLHLKEMGFDETNEPFVNVEIFNSIYSSPFTIADLTGLRNNCFLEMGYALGLMKKVIITAQEGTVLPFDSVGIPCFFWDITSPFEETIRNFISFWHKNVDRPSINTNNVIIL